MSGQQPFLLTPHHCRREESAFAWGSLASFPSSGAEGRGRTRGNSTQCNAAVKCQRESSADSVKGETGGSGLGQPAGPGDRVVKPYTLNPKS